MKSFKRFSSLVSGRLLHYSCKNRYPILFSLWFIWHSRQFNAGTTKYLAKSKSAVSNCIIYLSGEVTDYEIENASTDSSTRYVPLALRICKDIFNHTVGPDHGIQPFNYASRMLKYKQEQKLLRLFWKKVLTILRKVDLCDGVFSSSFNYVGQQEIAKACVELDIPLVILYKESIDTEGSLNHNVNNLKKYVDFCGTKILFYNQTALGYFRNIAGITEENSGQIGFPRADYLFNLATKSDLPRRRTITLFYSVFDQKRCNFPDHLWLELDVEKRVRDFYINFFRVAEKLRDSTFVVKLKSKNSKKIISDLLQAHHIAIPDNLTVQYGGDPKELIKNTRVALGFNTTCLLEALVLNCPLIEPLLDFQESDMSFSYLGRFPGVSNYVDSEEGILEILSNTDLYLPDRKMRKKALTHYFNFLDGKSIQRFEREIAAVL